MIENIKAGDIIFDKDDGIIYEVIIPFTDEETNEKCAHIAQPDWEKDEENQYIESNSRNLAGFEKLKRGHTTYVITHIIITQHNQTQKTYIIQASKMNPKRAQIIADTKTNTKGNWEQLTSHSWTKIFKPRSLKLNHIIILKKNSTRIS